MISPLAYIDPSARLGKNVTVHPFAYIDKNVEIGDGCEIMAHASILSGARLGQNNKVYQGAVVAAEPQDFSYTGEDSLCIVGNDNIIRENAVLIRATHSGDATVVGNGNFIMTGARLSHDVKVKHADRAKTAVDNILYDFIFFLSFPSVRFQISM